MKLEKKGMLAPYTIITSIITGMGFPILGSFVALDLKVIDSIYVEGLILVIIGGFLAQWSLAHSIHDLYHKKLDKRITLSEKNLKLILVISLTILLSIAIFLAYKRGWPILVFSLVGGIVSLYAEGLFHHESQMAFGAMFLVIGSFYVQAGTLNLDMIIWIKIFFISLFAFYSQYGWLLLYRLDDYKYNENRKNFSILVTKISLFFLILYILL